MTTESADEEPNGKALQCNHCPKTFRYKSEKIRHEMSHSPGFECETCSKKFSFISALRRHEKQHKRVGSVKCEECNRKFRDDELLRRHFNYAHKGSFQCSKCSSTFSSKQALRTHTMSHKPASERKFKCTFHGCDKSFNFSHHLKHHELTHTNMKQHYCSVCGKGFIQFHHLKAHLKTHDTSVSVCCDISGCMKKFSTEYAKRRHIATHKVKPDSGISSDSNSCDACVSYKEYAEDVILCAVCGENVHKTDIPMHSSKCGNIEDVTFKDPHTMIGSIKEENIYEQAIFKAKRVLDKSVDDCVSMIGDCIMDANTCVCAQISTRPNVEKDYDFPSIGNTAAKINDDKIVAVECNNNNIESIDRYSKVVLNFFDNKEGKAALKTTDSARVSAAQNGTNINNTQTTMSNMCEGCECANTCNIKNPTNCYVNGNIANRDISNVEYSLQGTVKIKDTFDIDIAIKVKHREPVGKVKKESDNFKLFSTCKDAIGNCIVEGSDGCLCARMMMDEQQAMAQEIDDITPIPSTENYTQPYCDL